MPTAWYNYLMAKYISDEEFAKIVDKRFPERKGQFLAFLKHYKKSNKVKKVRSTTTYTRQSIDASPLKDNPQVLSVKQITEVMSAIGKRGGTATLQKYPDHLKKIAKLGASARWSKK